jgi:hypothetical protein
MPRVFLGSPMRRNVIIINGNWYVSSLVNNVFQGWLKLGRRVDTSKGHPNEVEKAILRLKTQIGITGGVNWMIKKRTLQIEEAHKWRLEQLIYNTHGVWYMVLRNLCDRVEINRIKTHTIILPVLSLIHQYNALYTFRLWLSWKHPLDHSPLTQYLTFPL